MNWRAFSKGISCSFAGNQMLMIGTGALFAIKLRTEPGPDAPELWGMDTGLLALLFFTAATGLALLFWRHTSAMGWLLAIHLGFVLALFITLPYGKMVHGVYRLAALVRTHAERQGR